MTFFFFFSSRRRHTRLVSDWSSDVCSSDLRVDVRVARDVAAEGPDVADLEGGLEPDLALDADGVLVVDRQLDVRVNGGDRLDGPAGPRVILREGARDQDRRRGDGAEGAEPLVEVVAARVLALAGVLVALA